MKCTGEDSTLSEAKNNLEKLLELRKNKCGEIKYDTCICGTKDLEIVLNALKNSTPKKEIEKIIKEELPDDEICAVCDMFDVNGVEIKQKLQRILDIKKIIPILYGVMHIYSVDTK